MSAAASSMPPFLPGDRVKRGGVFMYRQLGQRLHCVRDCVLMVFNEDGVTRIQWFVGLVGITAKGDGTEDGRFYAHDMRLIIRKGAPSHA
jgi:hypothetical protein